MRINHLSIVIVFIGLLLNACDSRNTSEKETPTTGNERIRYSYDLKALTNREDDCADGACGMVTLNYPVFEPTTANAEALNKVIENRIQATLADFIMEADGDEALNVLTDMFLESYRKFKESVPDSQAPWKIEADVMVSATSRHFISLTFNTSSYTGGVHPNTLIEYINLSPEGEVITDLDYFFRDTEKLRTIAEQQFREKYKIAPEESLSEKGFIFDNDRFTLTENFGFTDSAIIFYYNSYDIAAYAQGPTALLIPLYNLKEIYKFN